VSDGLGNPVQLKCQGACWKSKRWWVLAIWRSINLRMSWKEILYYKTCDRPPRPGVRNHVCVAICSSSSSR